MPEVVTCSYCKGEGTLDVLISPHDDETELIVCNNCNGNGIINQMTDEEEDNYWADYW